MIDIIVPAFNNPDITFRCISALKLFGLPKQKIILVDNGSSEDIGSLRQYVDHYIRLDPNSGPYGAVNAGLKASQAKLVSVCCNDVCILPLTLHTLVSTLSDTHPVVGGWGILDAITEGKFDYYRLSSLAAARGLQGCPVLMEGVCFTHFVARRDVVDEIGLFDERFRLTYGDTDWEQRYADSGRQYVLAMGAPFFHGHGVTRKRLGLEADLRSDQADYAAFVDKWATREDVLAKHPLQSAQEQQDATRQSWQSGER